MARFEDAIGYVMVNEGGYADHPSDPGGVTNYGISLRYLKGTGEHGDLDGDGDIDADDVREMTYDEACGFFRRDFWDRLPLDAVGSQAVATRVLDMAVNMGPKAAVKVHQRAMNCFAKSTELAINDEPAKKLKVDGKFGQKTLERTNMLASLDPVEAMVWLRKQHAAFYKALVKKVPSMKVFLVGWLRRAEK
ncbi:hypothetical protein DRQ32_04160 [bacterium]|nr:MAG: hypothetical protein DRQ32_04160 [bacterium]RLE26507.1 MAG: hypothetical protein DRJ50_00760 [Actinomycetota bacterium]